MQLMSIENRFQDCHKLMFSKKLFIFEGVKRSARKKKVLTAGLSYFVCNQFLLTQAVETPFKETAEQSK